MTGAERFKSRLRTEVLTHPVIRSNPYTQWFEQGDISLPQARAFVVQFSVFSNQFLRAQLNKMLNAQTLETMRASKEILVNELGVGFRSGARPDDADLGSLSGSVEGGAFRFGAAHFELLVRTARGLGLDFADLGHLSLGTEATREYCRALIRLYGSEDYATAEAASWAVENWAAAGFWDQLVAGWRIFRTRRGLPRLDLAFFTWHARLEANHARHTWDELEQWYGSHAIDEDAFVETAHEMLDAVAAFWTGLDEQRKRLADSGGVQWHAAS